MQFPKWLCRIFKRTSHQKSGRPVSQLVRTAPLEPSGLSTTDSLPRITYFESIRDDGTAFLRQFNAPRQFSKVETELRNKFALHYRWSDTPNYLNAAQEEIKALEEVPGLSLIFMFHGDGRVREAALKNLNGAMIMPANIYALFWRLNDWAPHVRAAAADALERCMPQTCATIIAPALKAILPHAASWQRWSTTGPEFVKRILNRPDISDLFLAEIVETQQANLGLLFRSLSESSRIDQCLENIFEHAKLPHLRAMALDSLLKGEVRWPTQKMQQVWIDRSMGHARKERVWGNRPLTIEVDLLKCLKRGAMDNASIVRKVTADGMIAHRNTPGLIADIDRLACKLEDDANIGVRARINFLIRERAKQKTN